MHELLVDHFADLRVLARINLYARPAVLRAATVLDLWARYIGPDDVTGDAEEIASLLHDAGVPKTTLPVELALELVEDLSRLAHDDQLDERQGEHAVAEIAARLVAGIRA